MIFKWLVITEKKSIANSYITGIIIESSSVDISNGQNHVPIMNHTKMKINYVEMICCTIKAS